MNTELPEGWKWVKLDEISNKISLNKIKIKQKDYLETGNYPVVDQGQELIGGYYNDESLVIPHEPPYIVFGDHTKAKKYINFKFIAGADGVKVLKPKDNVEAKFLFYSLFTIKIDDKGYARHFQLLEKEFFPLPSKFIQQAIVSKIEELFSEIDKGIEQLKTAREQLKTYRQAVLKWAFEGKLTNDDVKVGKLPEGWKWVNIEFLLFDKKKGMITGPFGMMLKKSEHQEKGVPVLGIENIGEGIFQMPNKIFITEEKAFELKSFRVKENDIIISRSGTVGEICLLPKSMENSVISTNLIRVSLNLELVNPKYFVYLFQGGKVRQQVFDLCKGSSRAFLNQTILSSLNFPYCSIEEQQNVVQEIESRFSVADKMEENISESLQQAEVLRQSILKKAFEGKLVQTETQPLIKVVAKEIPVERKILAGKIIHWLHDTPRFGSTRFQKVLFVTEHFAEMEYETHYLQETAGPYDRDFTVAFKREMREKDWFDEETVRGGGTRFLVGENVGSLIADYPKYFREKGKQIRFVLELMKDCDTHEAELIATLYAVWNNRLIQKKPVDIALLTEDFFRWSVKKEKEFLEQEIRERYEWMKEVKLVPKGFGKVV